MSEMKTNYHIASEKLIFVKLQRCALHLNHFVCKGFIRIMDDLTWEFWIIVYTCTRIETGVYLVLCPLNIGYLCRFSCMIPAKFDSNWPSSIREEDFAFDNHKTK